MLSTTRRIATLTLVSLSKLTLSDAGQVSSYIHHQVKRDSSSMALDNSNKDDDVIITPQDPNTLFNFGPASFRDKTLFTCERPGGDPENGTIPRSAMDAWSHFMKQQGIDEVLVLLDDNELTCYEEPGLLKLYEEFGFQAYRNPMSEPAASTSAMKRIRACHESNRKIVVHCTHGQGRAGRVAAAWLVHHYGLSVQEATQEAIDTALVNGVTRMGSPSKLEAWLLHL